MLILVATSLLRRQRIRNTLSSLRFVETKISDVQKEVGKNGSC